MYFIDDDDENEGIHPLRRPEWAMEVVFSKVWMVMTCSERK